MDLRSLLAKTAGFAGAFRERLLKKADSIDAAFIFGSFAQGTETTESDIDLLVIGCLSGRELSRMLAPLKNELGREINPITITPDEFVERVEQKEPFILSVIEEPKIYILGGGDELAALPGSRAPQGSQGDQE
ncbi:MAG: nucleotidyltransferase domain-containing protein [Anaerolineales bacterium]|nr:nucleotidyltransferase domain-containing protein [Anaerolineales bacterium]